MQLQMNFKQRCVFNYLEWPITDDWLWELRALKEKKDKQYQIIKNILENKCK